MTIEQEIAESIWTRISTKDYSKEEKGIEIAAWSTDDQNEAQEVIALVKKDKVIYLSECARIDRYARRIVKEAQQIMKEGY